MPWSANDADEHKKGLSSEQKSAWAKIANRTLKSCKEEGGSDKQCEGRAIRIANSQAPKVKG